MLKGSWRKRADVKRSLGRSWVNTADAAARADTGGVGAGRADGRGLLDGMGRYERDSSGCAASLGGRVETGGVESRLLVEAYL